MSLELRVERFIRFYIKNEVILHFIVENGTVFLIKPLSSLFRFS